MPVLNLSALETSIREAITATNHAGHTLYQRRDHLTHEGLRAEWERLAGPTRKLVEKFTRELEAIKTAAGKIEEYERAELLRPVPVTGLTAAQEATVARLMARPSFAATESVTATITPHLSTVIATVLVEEIQARNDTVTDSFISGVLAAESTLYADAVKIAQRMPTVIGQLRHAISELEKATQFDVSVNGHAADAHARPGHYLVSIHLEFEEPVKIGTDGNIHV